MEGTLILALAIAIPIALFPAAFIWYINIGGILQTAGQARKAGERKPGMVKATLK